MELHGYPQTTPMTVTRPMTLLKEAFEARRILTYREGEALVVNDPYLRDRVDITFTRQGYVWEAPNGSLCFGGLTQSGRLDPGNTSKVVDDIIRQWAGIYLEG